MPRKQRIGDLGYRLRTRIIRGIRSRSSTKRWAATEAIELQERRIRQLAIYAKFLRGASVEKLTEQQQAWTREQVEEAIRTRGGTA